MNRIPCGTKHTAPVTVSIINAIETVLNPFWAAFFCGKLLRRLSFIGEVIVLRGILYYNLITEPKV